MTGASFEFERVARVFGRHTALSEVTLGLAPGQHTAILGPSGCGKTTLLRLLAGLDTPSAGRITMNGRTASDSGGVVIAPHRRGISMVFQDLALWPNLRVLGNVQLALSGSGLPRVDERLRARDALERCGIAELARRRPNELSGGQQQRVALARAIAPRPGLLLLDEPFTGLDLSTRDFILAQIRELAVTVGFTIVLVTHDPSDAASLCTRGVLMDGGRVSEDGPLDRLLRESDSSLMRLYRERAKAIGCTSAQPVAVAGRRPGVPHAHADDERLDK